MRNIQVNMGFTANTTQAQQSIQNLQNSLNNIANTKITVDGGSIDTAAQSARLLSEHLAKATNMTTGKIDFTALSNSLKAANTDLATLSNNLLAMGPKGQQAFSQIANAIAHAELSTRKANSALQSFGVTLMNTIKWQAASSMVHGLISTFNSAVSHIEKLDKSLNSIQIVSNKSSLEMASFAKQAQKAAAALSSTTTEYADAALIYFQQGLNEKAIAERTEATLKMAKVTGTAVATVSDQLTAIWNNFDNGTESLEHYVDVITALGAATASSTDEISDGLQKFAAIAETVGLSYEYAATALATVTAETRQSADVVGTAFKTLFARIQGLKLGETLDDGTTLNQYSSALAKVGIDIKMSNGELKSMNDILDEMGEKWERLNKDQQVALAQTVGGIRQYNQLIALMDNWDTFKINLEIAEDSKGELDKQFEIYQSSVEASAATLKQAKEALFENLLSPDMISGFNEALADTLDLLNTLIENAGGIGKLFEFGGLLVLQMVLPKLQGFLMSAATHMKDFIGYTKAAKMYELDTMAKTSHAIAGTSQRSNTRLSSSYEEGGGKFNRFERREDRRMARYDKWEAKANTAQEALEQGSQKGLQHGINAIRANVADAKAQAYSSTGATFMPNAQGVSGVDMDASAMTMRNQMIQEEAGYTATILDTKKQILALEDGLTDKQREGYKAYSDQVAKEQEALRLAREKQAVTKDAAEQSSRSGTMKVGSSKAGRDAKAAIKQGEIDQLEEERKKKISSLAGDKESISRQTSEINKEYNKKKEEVQNRHISNKQVDLKGDETKSMVEGFKDSDMSDTGQAITQSMTESLTQSADGSGPAASVENLEKLGQLQAQYNADAAKASGIYTELSGNIGEAGKRTEQQQKALKKTGDTMKTLGKDAKSGLVDSLKESAKQMEKTGDSAEGLKKVIKSLEDGSDIDLGELNPKEIDAVKKSVGDLDEGLTEASTSAGELAGAMAEDMASATGQDAKIFKSIADDAQTAKASALDADGAAKQLQNTLNTKPPIMPDPFGTVLQGAQQATAAFTSFAMGAQMLSTGITTAFDENASAVERLMGVMMILQGVMSTINAIQTAANLVDTIAVAIKTAKAAATKKEADADMKDTAATSANTVATSANAVAKLFAAMASKGLAGVVAGVLGAALIAGTIAIVANTVATQNEAKAQQEAAAAAQESAASHKENAEEIANETKEINENAEAYKKLYAVYQETGDAKSDFRKATVALAQSLDIENAELLALTNQYERLNEEIKEKLKLQNQDNKKAAKDSTKAQGAAIVTAVGGTVKDNPTRIIGATYSSKGQLVLDAGKNGYFIQRFLDSENGAKYKDKFYYDKDANALVATFEDDSEVPALTTLVDEMMSDPNFITAARADKGASSQIFKSYNDMKERGGEAWTGAADVVNAEESAIVDASFAASDLSTTENSTEFGKEYETYIQTILDDAGTTADTELGKRLIKIAEDKIKADDELVDLFTTYKATQQLPQNVIDYLASKHGGDKDKITDEEYELALTVAISEDALPSEIDTFTDVAQTMLDTETLEKRVTLIPELKNKVKDLYTKDQWDQFFADLETKDKDLYAELFPDQAAKERFMLMSPEDQAEILDRFEVTYGEMADQHAQAAAGQQDIINVNQGIIDRWQASGGEYLSNLGVIESDRIPVGKPITATDYHSTAMHAEIGGGRSATYMHDASGTIGGLTSNMEAMLTAIQDGINAGIFGTDTSYQDLVNKVVQEGFSYANYKLVSDAYAIIAEAANGYFGEGTVSQQNIKVQFATKAEAEAAGYTDADLNTEYQNDDEHGYVYNVTGYTWKAPEDNTGNNMYIPTGVQTSTTAIEEATIVRDNETAQAKTYDTLAFKNDVYNEGFDVDAMISYKEALSDIHSETIETRQEAEDLALANAKLARGLETIAENFDDISYGLKNKNTDLYAYSKALSQIKDAVKDFFGIKDVDVVFSEAFLSSEKNLQLMKEAAEGSESALQELRLAAAQDIIINAGLSEDIESQLTNQVDSFINSTEFANLEIGADLNTTSFGMALQKMLDDGQITADQMSAILQGIGGAPPVTYIEVPASQASQFMNTTDQEVLIPDPENPGNYTRQIIQNKNLSGVNGTTMVKIPIIGDPNSVDWNAVNQAGGRRLLSSSFQGHSAPALKTPSNKGGGSKPKKAEEVKKSNVVDRYKEITDSLNKNAQVMDEVSGAMDRLYGNARIAQMEKVNSLIQKEIELNNIKRKEALRYLEEDKQSLDQVAQTAGIQFTYDEFGNIRNYTDQMTALYDALDATIAHANADGNANENEQEVIDSIQEKIDAVKDAQASYEETLQVLQEIDQTIIDKFNAWQDNNFEQLNLKIEMAIELNENDMALLEYKLSEIEDDAYSAVEALSLMWSGKDGNQMDIYLNNLTIYKDSVDELNTLYNNSEISHAKFIEGLQSSSDSILSELENIQSLDKTMQEYYSDTLANVNSEIEKYTNLMDNANSALEHFSSMMELLGKQTDYEAIGIILSAQAQVAQDKYDASARTYKMFADEAAEKKQAYVNALTDPAIGEHGLKQLESEWLAAEEAAAEAQDQMLSDAEAWGEALGAILDNALAKFAQKLEKALTREFGSFDNLSTQLERANSLQEEYLTTTNKIYETNKLMRQAQNEIDKTTNTVAKQKLKQFINETNQMQQQGELSQYELEIQQAKYDLLLAEIALREAQNAKSTVRLQRDSEGNFGYVYTADQQAVADAQQKFEDAQNSLYNKGLEGANDYAQKSIEIQQEATEAMAEIAEKHRNGEYQSEAEYQAALESAQQYYYEKLQQYAHLYQVAVTTDSRVVADAWSSDFASMVDSADRWRQHVGDYVSDINGAFGEYSKVMDKLREQTVGKDLTELAAKTAQLAKNSEELATKLLSEKGVINALDQELSLVGQVTQAYAEQRDALMAMVAEYKEYLRLLGIEIRTQSDRTDVLETGMQVTVKSGVKNWAKTDSSTLGSVLANGEYKVLQYTNDEVQISNSAGSTGWVKKTDLVGFDTGGYTGSWGSYGKLAMLHEKEMVLNKQDTENLLASMEFLNRILEMIDLQALSNQLGGILTMPSLSHHNSEILEQNVHIEASFPGVSDRNEIEEAFNNLINTASQYANRR